MILSVVCSGGRLMSTGFSSGGRGPGSSGGKPPEENELGEKAETASSGGLGGSLTSV